MTGLYFELEAMFVGLTLFHYLVRYGCPASGHSCIRHGAKSERTLQGMYCFEIQTNEESAQSVGKNYIKIIFAIIIYIFVKTIKLLNEQVQRGCVVV